MDAIFHEKQEGSLCAQHCLNALLQGPYFTPMDLATLAQQMDEEERCRMAESGVDSEEYRRFLEQPSQNFDDSGYFSVQVISSALRVWGIDLVPYSSSHMQAVHAQRHPTDQQAFICNYRDHWFSVRKLGYQWFNLNSLLTGPELLSDTYLAIFLAQLQQEGYSIFVVCGSLPDCEADGLLRLTPAEQTIKPRLLSEAPAEKEKTSSSTCEGAVPQVQVSASTDEDEQLKAALQMSLADLQGKEDEYMLMAMRLSELEDKAGRSGDNSFCADKVVAGNEEDEELQKVLKMSLESQKMVEGQKACDGRVENRDERGETSEEEDLQKALRMSLQCVSDENVSLRSNEEDEVSKENAATSSVKDENQLCVEEVRRRRQAFLDSIQAKGKMNSGTQSKPNS